MDKIDSKVNREDINEIKQCELVYNGLLNHMYRSMDYDLVFIHIKVKGTLGFRDIMIPVTKTNVVHFMDIIGINHYDDDSQENQNILEEAVGKIIICNVDDNTGRTILGNIHTSKYDFNPFE